MINVALVHLFRHYPADRNTNKRLMCGLPYIRFAASHKKNRSIFAGGAGVEKNVSCEKQFWVDFAAAQIMLVPF